MDKQRLLELAGAPITEASDMFKLGFNAFDPDVDSEEDALLAIPDGASRSDVEEFLDGWRQASFDDPNPRGGDVCPTCGQPT